VTDNSPCVCCFFVILFVDTTLFGPTFNVIALFGFFQAQAAILEQHWCRDT